MVEALNRKKNIKFSVTIFKNIRLFINPVLNPYRFFDNLTKQWGKKKSYHFI